MKIEQLRFRNLNSLAGEWVIDFTDRELSDEGIFLITGPTGAGKTTILDAITLALYGQTPRLSSISTGGNEIMSRQQVNCFSEVIFSAGGKRYRALWSQRRARGKADGRLQAPYREFEDMTGAPGKPIDKIREVSRAVLEAVGMDFDGFTRSVMLTQGQFARFLNAQPADRAHILEKITGTDFYSAISRRCLRMRGEAAKKSELLHQRLADCRGVLSSGERAALEAEQKAIDADCAANQKEQQAVRSAREWAVSMDSAIRERAQAEARGKALIAEISNFELSRERLERSRKAAGLREGYAVLKNRRRIADDAQTLLKELDGSGVSGTQSGEERTGAMIQAMRAAGERSGSAELKAGLDGFCGSLETALADFGARKQDAARASENLRKAVLDEENATRQAGEADRAVREKDEALTLAQKNLDAALDGKSPEYWDDLATLASSTLNAIRSLQVTCGSIATQKSGIEQKEEQRRAAGKKAEEDKRVLSELREKDIPFSQKEYDLLKDNYLLARRVSDLEEERHRLTAGQPCPLCGSTVHPYAEGAPLPDLRKEAMGAAEKKLRELQNRASRLDGDIAGSQRLIEALSRDIATGEKELARLNAGFDAGRAECLARAGSCQVILPESASASDAASVLARAAEKWQADAEKAKKFLKKIRKLAAERDRAQSLLNQARQTGHTFSLKKTDAEGRRKTAETAAAGAGSALAAAGEALGRARQAFANGLATFTASRDEAQAAFSQALRETGYADEAAWARDLLPGDEHKKLEEQERTLQRELDRQKALEEAAKKKYDTLAASRATDMSIAELEARLQELERVFAEKLGRRGTISADLARDAAIHGQKNALIAESGEADDELKRWDDLNNLIGSSSGGKFSNFAQSLTLATLAQEANLQLKNLAPRYTLETGGNLNLDFDVIDSWQENERRSARNLSGGESFLVSLSLALALSSLSHGSSHIETMFLDEGFGTLDPEAMETALNALAALRQGGSRLVGIISHVEELKEKIDVQVRVSRGNNGVSTMEGPGISRGGKKKEIKSLLEV